MTTARLCLVLLLSWPAVRVAAQTSEPDLAAIKAKADLGDEDRSAIRAFVSKRVDAIRTKDDAAAQQSASELRGALDGTDAFKKAYAAMCIEAAGAAYKNAEPAAAARLLSLLGALNNLDTLPVFLDAVQDSRVGVRATAVLGLRTLREKLAAAGRDTYQKALGGLKDAGKREKSRDTLKLIYSAMNYADLPAAADAKATAAALLDVLDERARQCTAGKPEAAGAEDAGLRLAKGVMGSMDEGEKKRLTIATATLLKYALQTYTAGSAPLATAHERDENREIVELRNATERLILGGEELLTALLKPDKAPTVSDNMRRLNAAGMRSEWERWAGLLQKAVGQDFSLLGAQDES
jgi:hypothetical protein